MPSPIAGLSPRALSRKFLNREDGSVTIEAVLWLPMFMLFFVMIADVSLIFNGQSRLQRLVQDANRYYSVGRLTSDAETEAFLQAATANMSSDVEVETTYDNDLNLIVTVLSVPAKDLEAVGLISAFFDMRVTVWSTHMKEF